MVSICCAAYNQAAFIAQTLDSFLAQETNFPIEILIHDDASTDGTAQIIRRYAQAHPQIIKPLFQIENQYSRGVAIDPTFNYRRAQGKYIALCEGDDFWCDAGKLQRQVDAMEAHPEYTFCFTNGTICDTSMQRPDRDFLPYYQSERASYIAADHPLTVGEMCGIPFAPTASFLFPRAVLSKLPPAYWDKRCPHGDLKLRLFCTAAGLGLYQHAFTCVYRENVPGSAMNAWSREEAARVSARAASVAEMLLDVDEFSQMKYTKQVGRFRDWYLYVLLWNAPDGSALKNADCKRVYAALPIAQRIRYRLKRLLPRSWINAAKRACQRSKKEG
ncbi:MAG: glycosyltransferase [Clostridia bacterium]